MKVLSWVLTFLALASFVAMFTTRDPRYMGGAIGFALPMGVIEIRRSWRDK